MMRPSSLVVALASVLLLWWLSMGVLLGQSARSGIAAGSERRSGTNTWRVASRAQLVASPDPGIRDALQRYSAALERLDANAVKKIQPSLPASNLAKTFKGTRLLIVHGDDHGDWPAVLDTNVPGAECFDEFHLGIPADPKLARALENTRVFRLVCP